MTHAQQTRKTYQSQEATYKLDSAKIGDIISDLATYMQIERDNREREYPERPTPLLHFMGRGRRLVLGTEVSDNTFLTSVDLAELIFDEDGGLTLKVYQHPNLAINPSDLKVIAERYSLKSV